ncbi:restriction endonuclease subunit S [Shewanella sp. SP2S2-4]|uniref:restriction endonuclease subunit S n=1 Tax=Shewanella sp. SP2S2-4 TaxID=3063539 RepID=UPI0028908FDC|nr:restriction endonuclease subunit S [Shewanella sp. SP2S2-4]MDT3272603.1 restriction endonuclease subunit S [Shewanella sp. SP2S2-4]
MSQAINQVIPEGYKQTDIGVIPENWDVITLDDAANFLDGQRRPVKSGDRARIKGQYPYYGASGIVDYVNDYIFDGEFILLGEDGENILSRNLPLAFRANGKIWVNNHAHVMIPKSNFHIDFLTSYLESLDYSLLNSGTAQPKLNKQACLNIKVLRPSLKEQTAIANALSDIDALLSELEKLIAKKQAIKTATMQQLLTGKTRLPQFGYYSDINSTDGAVEGKRNNASATNVNVGACDDGYLASQESVGMNSRRKGTKTSELGEIPEDWDIKALGELVTIQSGESPSKFQFKPDGVPYFKVEQLNNGLVYAEDTEYRIDTKKVVKANSIIFPKRGASILLNKIRVLKNDSFMDTNLMTLTCGDSLVSLYLYNMLTYRGLDKVADTTSIPQINNKHIIPLLIPVPNIKEQTAIATILSDMDNEIKTLEQRLSKTRQIKQGMMQELLTGKTRLPFDKDTISEVSV